MGMEVIRNNDTIDATALTKPVVTIGNFDGCHLGHQEIFRKARKPDGIHFEDRRGGHDVTDRAMDPWQFSEIVDRWWVKQDEVCECHLDYCGEGEVLGAGNLDL